MFGRLISSPPPSNARLGPLARILSLSLALIAACGESEPPPPPPLPPPVVVRRVTVAAPRPLASPAAFDLVLASAGPLFLFAPPSSRGGGLRAQQVDEYGGAVGEERVLVASGSGAELLPELAEVEAATNAGRLRVGYVLRDQLEFTMHSLSLDDSAEVAGEPVDLGASERPGSQVDEEGQPAVQRGALAASARGSGLELLFRRGDGPCAGQVDDGSSQPETAPPGSRCARFAVSRPDSPTTRRGGGYSLPGVCGRALVGFSEVGGVMYQALCSVDESTPATTVFSIQFEPRYAHAERVLAGCEPTAMSSLEDGVLVRASCGNETERGAYVAQAGRERAEGEISAQCNDADRIVVTHPGGTLELSEPRDRVEAFLPLSMVGANARAVWTGASLLVAEPLGREVALRRYECLHGTLRRNDHV